MTLTPISGFPYYISLVEGKDHVALFNSKESFEILARIPEEKSTHRYAPEKWSIKQLVGHMADHERIMIYRALRFSRKDDTVLSGYDQSTLVDNAPFDKLPYKDILDDFRNVRQSSISFIKTLQEDQLSLTGVAWKFEISVKDLLLATIGHEIHHMRVIQERYL